MSKRIRRKSISNTFKIKGHLCKVIIDPWCRLENGFYNWNVGFAVGKSNRQINDWYHVKQNRRRRSLHKHMTGTEGFKTIPRGFNEVLRLRWLIPAGDTIFIDCTSADPEKQWKTFSRWRRWHPDWFVNEHLKEFYWTRP